MYWVALLHYFESRGYFGNGLTLPFVAGAITLLEPAQPAPTVKELLEEMIGCAEGKVTMMHCTNLDEYVFSMMDNESEQMMKQYRTMYRAFGNLVITDGSFQDFGSVDGIINELQNEYDDHIAANKFSKNHGVWDWYSPIEENRIKELL